MKYLSLALLTWCAVTAAAQTDNLPIVLTADEKLRMPAYLNSFAENRDANAFTTPPAGPVRTMAEWEEVQGYLVTYTSYTGMVRDIIRHGKQQCRMYVVTNNPSSTISSLQSSGIDTANITFLNLPYNSIWCRDYGQWAVYTNAVDSLLFVDWIYNRPRANDDNVPVGLANALNVPLYQTTQAPNSLVHTGGNFMADGLGTGFSSKLILDENNSKSEAQIDTIMSRFMGINRYIKMNTLPYDDIHHIDMHLKLLDEETLLVGEYPTGIADGPQIEANLQYVLSNFETPFGTPYRVIRIPMPADNGKYPHNGGRYFTYTNASFINKTIIVPTYNIPADTTALRIWRQACPGYNVVGINSTASIGSLGALHCITKEIGATAPLLITHQRLRDTYNTTTPYTATATVQHSSGIQQATLYYTTDTTQPYQALPMSSTGNNVWSAQLPAQPAGTQVFYYIHAQANSGKQQVRPIVAPQGFYHFTVLGTTGLAQNTLQPADIFPNPAQGLTCIPVTCSSTQPLSITCHNTLGETVATVFTGVANPGNNRYFINTTPLPAGLYLIKYTNGHTETVKKLVVR